MNLDIHKLKRNLNSAWPLRIIHPCINYLLLNFNAFKFLQTWYNFLFKIHSICIYFLLYIRNLNFKFFITSESSSFPLYPSSFQTFPYHSHYFPCHSHYFPVITIIFRSIFPETLSLRCLLAQFLFLYFSLLSLTRVADYYRDSPHNLSYPPPHTRSMLRHTVIPFPRIQSYTQIFFWVSFPFSVIISPVWLICPSDVTLDD